MASRLKKWALIGIGLVGLYALAGFYVLPAVLKSQLEKKLPASLHRAVSIEAIAFNPFTLTLVVDGFRATEPTGEEFLSFQHFLANLQLSSLFQRSLNFREIHLQRPSVAFIIQRDGTTNFSNLGSTAETPPATPAAPPEPSKPLLIRIDALKLDDGQAHFEDQSRAKPYKTDIGPIDFEVTNFKTDPDWRHPHRFLARMDPDTTLAWSGNFSVTPFRSDGTIDLSGVHLPAFEPYYGDHLRARIIDGIGALKVDYTMETVGQFALALRNGSLALTGVTIGMPQSSTPLITLPRFAANGVDLDLTKRTLSIGALDLTDAALVGTRTKDGTVDLQQLFAPAEGTAPAQPPPTDTPTKDAASPWQIAVDRATIANAGLRFTDQGPTKPAEFSIDQITLALQQIRFPGTAPMPAEASLRWNGQGTLGLTGTVRHTPVAADLDATIKDFALAPFQPYISDALFLAVTSGHLDSTTHVAYGQSDGGGAPLQVTGDLALLRLATTDTRSGESLVKLDALRFSKMDVQTQPTRVAIDQIHLKNFQGQASTLKEGGFNVTSLRKPGPTDAAQPPQPEAGTPAKPAGEAEPPPSITVRNIVLDNAALSVTDRTLQPPLATGITQLTGRIQQLSYPTPAKTVMDLSGKAAGRAPLRITGHMQPKGKDSQMDLLVSLKGYDVPVFTGYSSKYVGYPFQKGKLSLELKYDVANRKLTGENAVLVDQLTLGPKTDSPDATSLPVKLALAILTDRQGQIHLDVPVGGDLDDPQFTFGRVILRALLNILEKVATSPFALLGALAGGGGDAPNTIDFQPGTAELAPTETAKLDKLAKALDDRPALRLEVSASVDPNADRLMLAKDKLRRVLEERLRTAAAKPGKGGKKGAVPTSAEGATLDEVEYERMVRELHGNVVAAERTAQPGTEVTLDSLPPPPPPPPPPSGFWGFFKKLNPFGGESASESESRQAAAPPPPPPVSSSTGSASTDPSPVAATSQPPLVPFAEVEAAVLAKQPVSQEDLYHLRKARTDAVLNYLTEQGHLGPDRAFAAADEAGASGDAAQAPAPQATLKLN